MNNQTTNQSQEEMGHSKEPRNWHYSEPWKTEWSPEGIDIKSSEGLVAQTYQKYPKAMEQANAARIVACVNFCEGITTGWLENAKTLDSILSEQIQLRDKLRSQLSAAQAKADWVDKWGPQILRYLEGNALWKEMTQAKDLRAILSSDEKAKEG